MLVNPRPDDRLEPKFAPKSWWLKFDGPAAGNCRFVGSGCTWRFTSGAACKLFDGGGKYEFSGKTAWIAATLLRAMACCVPIDGPGIGFQPSQPAPWIGFWMFGNDGGGPYVWSGWRICAGIDWWICACWLNCPCWWICADWWCCCCNGAPYVCWGLKFTGGLIGRP